MPLRIGVVGVGHLGYHHARICAALPDMTLVGIVDIDPGNRQRAASDFNVPGFESVDALLAAGIDAASVAAPTTVHHPITLKLLEAGVNVLVEKPIATTVDQAREMVDCAQVHDLILQVGHIERFNGAVIALFEAVRNPRFIECHRLSPYPNRGDDVSVILDLMIHDLDIVCALVKSEVVSVDAVGVPVFSPQEDIANVRVRFASGCVANLTSSRVSVERMRKIRIFEENTYVSTNYTEQEVLVYHKKTGSLDGDVSPMDLIEIESLPVKREEPLKLELAAFADCVQRHETPLVSGKDGLAALELAQKVISFIRNEGT